MATAMGIPTCSSRAGEPGVGSTGTVDGTFRMGAGGDGLSAGVQGMTTAWMSLNSDPWPDAAMAVGGGASSVPQGLFGGANATFQAPSPNPVADSGPCSVRRRAGAMRMATWTLGRWSWEGWNGPNLSSEMRGTGRRSPSRAQSHGPGGGTKWRRGLCVGGLRHRMERTFTSRVAGHHLWVNQGGGIFRDHDGLGVLGISGATVGVTWADFDNDGWLDLLVANRTGSPHLLRNLGNGQFVRETQSEITRKPAS